ncbi:MAG TPA: hypothetical protein VJ827_07445 [Rubrobacter sp.]|nr:hypothetical protein [Rubrobacter sp.]
MMAEEKQRGGSLLGVVAYVLVPGERRVRAAGHFRKAGFEVLKGVGTLLRPVTPPESSGAEPRERIEIE